MQNINTIWINALEKLELTLGRFDFPLVKNSVLRDILIDGEECFADIQVDSNFTAMRVKSAHSKSIEEVLTSITGKNTIVKISIKTDSEKSNSSLQELPMFHPKDKNTLEPFEKPKLSPLKKHESNLNPDYTFSSFVECSQNRLAVAFAKSVSEDPGKDYNPLFLYSGVGLGKTHLMHAIGNELHKKFPDKKITYATTEEFMNLLTTSIKNNNREKLVEKFRLIDVLLLDDIQFLAGKEGLQEEFFNVFNTLYTDKKQIVITSDRPPKDISHLQDRILSRLQSGMIHGMQSPDYISRLAILELKQEKFNHFLTREVLDVISNAITTNIRELEGAFKQIMAIEKAEGRSINGNEARTFLMATRAIVSENALHPSKIVEKVSEHFSYSKADLKGPRRPKSLSEARQICMYLLRKHANMPFLEIGDILGGRDHTTIMHGVKQIEEKMIKDSRLHSHIQTIEDGLLGRFR